MKKICTLLAIHFLVSCSATEKINSAPKIVGGSVPEGDNPGIYSAVAITLDGEHRCTGVLTNENMILTAAHCLKGVSPSFDLTRFDIVFSDSSLEAPFESKRKPSSFLIHPEYKGIVYDVAWMKFDGGIPVGYRPINILTRGDLMTADLPLTLVGFGAIDDEMSSWGTRLSVETKVKEYIASGEFAGVLRFGETPGKSACRGDSGGPAYVNLDGQWYLVGLTKGPDYVFSDSWTCATGNGLYSFVGYHLEWIEKTSGEKLPIAEIQETSAFKMSN